MTAQELKEKLKEEDIRKLLIEMGATFYYEDDDMWITDTILLSVVVIHYMKLQLVRTVKQLVC